MPTNPSYSSSCSVVVLAKCLSLILQLLHVLNISSVQLVADQC